jgi:hypothetical protein
LEIGTQAKSLRITQSLWHTMVDLVWVSSFGELEEGGPIFLLPWGPKILLVALQSVGVPWPSNTDILTRCPLYSQYVYPSNTDILACYPLYSQYVYPSNTDILAYYPLYSQYVYPSNTYILAYYPLYSQ